VITPDGIVGKLKDVFAHTSQVLVISDQTSGAGVLLESTRLRGVLRGNALGQPQIINMLPDERVKAGEKVITSGGDQIYPRGIPVGVVDKVVADTANPPYIDIVIKPAANLGHLEELLVITEASEHMPPTEQQDLAQSAAEGAAVSQQRASDILAERLPGLSDPSALADQPG
jgi:rod shape-determining protein MreC